MTFLEWLGEYAPQDEAERALKIEILNDAKFPNTRFRDKMIRHLFRRDKSIETIQTFKLLFERFERDRIRAS